MADLLQPDDYQDSGDPAINLAERRESAIAGAVKAALRELSSALSSVDLKGFIASHNIVGIAGALSLPRVTDALLNAYKPIAQTFTDAAEGEAEQKFGGLVVYDPLVAAGQLSGQQQTFIGSILGQSADTIRDELIRSLRMGVDPEEIANALKAVIGLTPRQAAAVANFRNLLESADGQALTRALRDSRYDATVQAWISGLAPVDQAKVDAMVLRYAERMLTYRATTIARTESLKAAVGGVRDAYVQAVQSGRLLPTEVRRKWKVVFDERLCPICGSIPLLNPNGVGVLEPYLSISGPIMFPLVHPNCRCTESYTADLSRITSSPFETVAA